MSLKRKWTFIGGQKKTHFLPDFKGDLFISSVFAFDQGVQSKPAPSYEKQKKSSSPQMDDSPVSVYVLDIQKVSLTISSLDKEQR